jgi:hypothetical protein
MSNRDKATRTDFPSGISPSPRVLSFRVRKATAGPVNHRLALRNGVEVGRQAADLDKGRFGLTRRLTGRQCSRLWRLYCRTRKGRDGRGLQSNEGVPMTAFNTDLITDQPDCMYMEIDRRFNIVIERTESGLSLRVYPRTDGELWDAPFTTFEVNEQEIVALEEEITSDASGRQP